MSIIYLTCYRTSQKLYCPLSEYKSYPTATEIYTARERDYTVILAPETAVSSHTHNAAHRLFSLKGGNKSAPGFSETRMYVGKAETRTTSDNTSRQEFAARLKHNFKPHSQSLVDFNYLKHQIKRTKCSSQEYAG